MKIFCIIILGFAVCCFAFSKKMFAGTKVDSYINKQLKRQQYGDTHKRIRKLDFSPFIEDLNNFKNYAKVEEKISCVENVYEIQELFDSEQLSSYQLVLFYLKQIQLYDPQLNAILELNPEVLKQAISIDNKRLKRRSPLHGIPVLLKDNIGVAGKMHTSAGAAALKDARCDRDAELVKNLRNNGALLLGKTNLSEWANFMSFSSANGFSSLGGQTKNPHGLFDVGGSSSGSASAVAKNLCSLSIGTETSGSIIYPASQNSVFALKPTLGIISQDRIIPITSKQDTAGPMAQNVTDLAVLFFAMQGEYRQANVLDHAALKKAKIGILYGQQYQKNFREGDKGFRQKMHQQFEKLGATVKEIEVNEPLLGMVDAYHVMVYDFPRELQLYLQQTQQKIISLQEVFNYNNRQKNKYAPFGQGIIRYSLKKKITKQQYQVLVQNNREITKKTLDNLFDKNDIEIIATLSNYFTSVYAPCGYPAISIPLGYRDSGEPIGMTLIAKEHEDKKLLDIAYSYEQFCKRSK
ncbi:amidase family protein [Candidatus Uabimicrobium sp. HlEnr_7]|uniref:amidase family protein n=1 Tax=Candidatus Uabimicrobium helgolandensis TaxID=3095367 RepID=UPI003556A77A